MSSHQKAQEGEKLLIYPLPESNLEKLVERLRGFGYKFIQANSIAELQKVKPNDPTRLAVIELDPKKENADAMEFISSVRNISQVMKIIGVFRGRLYYNPQPLIKKGIDFIYQIPFEEEVLINCIFEYAPIELDNDHLTIDSLSRVNVVELEWCEALPFDLFICLPKNRKIMHYRQKGQKLDDKFLEKFRQHQNYAVYIKKSELATYYSYTAQVLSRLTNDPRLSKLEKEKKLSIEIQKIMASMFSHPSTNEKEGQEVVENVRKVLSQIKKSEHQDQLSSVLMELAAQNMSNYTHCRNVATYCALFGLALGLDEPEVLQMGGFLHDLGMSEVDPKLLIKPWTEMTDSERALMKRHTTEGIQIIEYKKMQLPDRVIKMITQHHERPDGSGYPLGLKSHEIDVYAKICAFADEFDELTSLRFGHKTCTPIEAIKRLAGLDGFPASLVYEEEIFKPLVISFLEQFGEKLPPELSGPLVILPANASSTFHREQTSMPEHHTHWTAPNETSIKNEIQNGHVKVSESKVDAGKVKIVEEQVRESQSTPTELFVPDSGPLFEAIKAANLEQIQKALQSGIDINAKNPEGFTPLMVAVFSGNRNVTKTVLRAKANLNIQNSDGMTALMLAIETQNFEIFNLLLVHAFENSFVGGTNPSKSGSTWSSHILDLNLVNQKGETALMVAARVGHDQMFEALIDAGANLYHKNNEGQSIVEVAKAHGHKSILQTIARYEAFLNQGSKAIVEEAKESESKLQTHIDVRARDKFGQTPLMTFSAIGNADMVQMLIAHNSEIEAKDFAGQTALMLAAKSGSAKVVGLLLNAKANPNAKDSMGKFPLLHAIEAGCAQVIKPITQAGGKINARYLGATPLMIAASLGQLAVVQALVECGANVADKDAKGKTAIDYAKARSHANIVEYLVEVLNSKEAS